MQLKTLVVIPTYNEADNIVSLISEIRRTCPQVHILVVDDGSPDGTAALVEKLGTQYPEEINCLKRQSKQGLGRAYIAGFGWGLENGYDVFVEMDADFSHRPQDLPKVLQAIERNDFVVGSRWIKGGSTLNWSLWRKVVSIGGSIYARLILGYPFYDWTGGFNAWRADVLRRVGLGKIESEGYSFQIELKYRSSFCGFKGVEVPIAFDERREGQSKMSSQIVWEALYFVWRMRLKSFCQKAG